MFCVKINIQMKTAVTFTSPLMLAITATVSMFKDMIFQKWNNNNILYLPVFLCNESMLLHNVLQLADT